MHAHGDNGFARHSAVGVRPINVLPEKRLVQPREKTQNAPWKLSFWTRGRDESGLGRRIEIWCKSEGEARQRYGEYRRILESHTLIVTTAELVGPSGETITDI
jgi:hypothetical protein